MNPHETMIYVSTEGHKRAILPTAEGYVGLGHNEKYALYVTNPHDVRCAVEVKIDGLRVGRWVLPAYFRGDTLIERPEQMNKKFTFFKAGTEQATAAGLDGVSDYYLGLVQFTFAYERMKPVVKSATPHYGNRGGSAMGGTTRGGGGLTAGGTGLTGRSDQVFGETTFDEDPNRESYITTLRLGHDPRRDELVIAPLPGRFVPPPLTRG